MKIYEQLGLELAGTSTQSHQSPRCSNTQNRHKNNQAFGDLESAYQKKWFSYFSAKTYVVGTQQDGSFEHPKHMLKLTGQEIFTFLCSK